MNGASCCRLPSMPAACRPASSSKPTLLAAPTSAAMVLRARARSLIGAACAHPPGSRPGRCSGPAGPACSPSGGAGTARRSCPSTAQPGARRWPGRPAGDRSCAAVRCWHRACAARPASAAAGHPAAVRSAATGCGPPPRPAAGAGTGPAAPTALRSRPDHPRPGATPSPVPQPPAHAGLAGSLADSRHPATASSSMAASPHPRADFPRTATLMHSDSPDRPASCGLRRDSGKPGRHGFQPRGQISSAAAEGICPSAAIGIKEPGSRGSQALQAGAGPEDSVVAHVRPEDRMAAILRCRSLRQHFT